VVTTSVGWRGSGLKPGIAESRKGFALASQHVQDLVATEVRVEELADDEHVRIQV
jgi:hypothetical protein